MKKLNKYISIGLITVILFVQGGVVRAYEMPTPPESPTVSTSTPPENTTPTINTTTPAAPSTPTAPTLQEYQQEVQQDHLDSTNQESSQPKDSDDSNTTSTPSGSNSTTQTSQPISSGNQTGSQSNSGNVGDTSINTGDATNTAGLVTNGNTNTSLGGGATSGASVANTGNLSGSTNSGALISSNNDTTSQTNTAHGTNSLTQNTLTGTNTASDNLGNTSIKSGDANTTGTVITAVNNNVDGVAVAEFNIEDDHQGDIVLDFAAGCIINCQIFDLTAKNTNNGADSTNSSSILTSQNTNTFQANDADLGNDLVLLSDSGKNTADRNGMGDTSIETGNANVAANVLTVANNNLAGNVIYGVVNIFGDLVGDLILPESAFNTATACTNCGGSTLAGNIGNGSDSTNDAFVSQTNSENTFQLNDADIENNLILNGTTSGNLANRNTGGDSSIETGDVNVDASVLNIANSNIQGGDWWIVLVNEAGNWVGKILGAPEGSNMIGSAGTEFLVDDSGQIIAVNSGNGEDSQNNSEVVTSTQTNTSQSNTGKVVNNLNLTANTGGNSVSDNTAGNSSIKTGDANIVANVVNILNNNISGGGRIFVTVVNVFGSWVGDFVSPGQAKQNNTANNQGGTSDNNTSNVSNQPSNPGPSNNSSSGNSQSSTKTLTGTVLAAVFKNNNRSIVNTFGGSQSNDSNSNTVEPQTLIAGVNNLTPSPSTKGFTLNLAWVLLFLPIFSGGFLLYRRLITRGLPFRSHKI